MRGRRKGGLEEPGLMIVIRGSGRDYMYAE